MALQLLNVDGSLVYFTGRAPTEINQPMKTTELIQQETKPKKVFSIAAGILMAGVVGAFSWDSPVSTLAVLILPLLMNLREHRWWPLLIAATYAAVGNRDIPGMIGTFFEGATFIGAIAAFLGMTLAQAIPFAIYRADASRLGRFWRMMAALTLLTIPPIGLLAWKNPLLAAGLFFPSIGYAGVLCMALTLSLLAAGGVSFKRGNRWTCLIAAVCLLAFVGASVRYRNLPGTEVMQGWHSIDTQFDPVDVPGDDHIRGQAVADLLTYSVVEGIDVIVLPESVFSPMKPVDQITLMPMAYQAERLGITILAGNVVIDPAKPSRWRNTVQAFGATQGIVDESRAPMPVGNWRPLTGTGVVARPWSTDLVSLNSPRGLKTAAMSICFEDTVIWPHWGLLTGKADVMVSMGNLWALTGTSAEAAQDTSATLLSRLAAVPLVRAKNTMKE